jgi:hypothetical protein
MNKSGSHYVRIRENVIRCSHRTISTDLPLTLEKDCGQTEMGLLVMLAVTLIVNGSFTQDTSLMIRQKTYLI